MFNKHLPNMQGTDDVALFGNFAVFVLTAGGIGAVIWNYLPFIPAFAGVGMSMLGAAGVVFFLSTRRAKRNTKAREGAAREYRDMKAELQEKQIDEMRSKNSRIPKVKR